MICTTTSENFDFKHFISTSKQEGLLDLGVAAMGGGGGFCG